MVPRPISVPGHLIWDVNYKYDTDEQKKKNGFKF